MGMIAGRHCPEANKGGGPMGQGMMGRGFRGSAAGRLFPGGDDVGAGIWGGSFGAGIC
jgi:hypothetical protein